MSVLVAQCDGYRAPSGVTRAAAGSDAPRRRSPPAQPVEAAGTSGLRQQQAEGRAAPGCRLDLDLAVVKVHGAEDHGQPDAAAAFLGREVQVEDLFYVFR